MKTKRFLILIYLLTVGFIVKSGTNTLNTYICHYTGSATHPYILLNLKNTTAHSNHSQDKFDMFSCTNIYPSVNSSVETNTGIAGFGVDVVYFHEVKI